MHKDTFFKLLTHFPRISADFPPAIKIGKNPIARSFARWETYRADQSRAADLLLRALKKGGKKLLKEITSEQKTEKKDVA